MNSYEQSIIKAMLKKYPETIIVSKVSKNKNWDSLEFKPLKLIDTQFFDFRKDSMFSSLEYYADYDLDNISKLIVQR